MNTQEALTTAPGIEYELNACWWLPPLPPPPPPPSLSLCFPTRNQLVVVLTRPQILNTAPVEWLGQSPLSLELGEPM